MNELGNRLDALARRATSSASITNPATVAPLMVDRQPKRRGLALGLIASVLVAVMLFLWQSQDSGTTSIAAGQVPDEAVPALLDGDTCAVESVLDLLRAGIPTYDYEPAGSFDALAMGSAAVASGQVDAIARTDVSGSGYIELTVSGVFDVSLDDGADTPRIDIQTIAYPAQWVDNPSQDPLATPVGIEGLDFFAFLSPLSGIQGGWVAGPEGLYVSCTGPALPVMENGAGPNDPSDPGRWWAVKLAEQAAGQAMADAAAATLDGEEPFFHTVEEGDVLASIAERYNVTADSIIRVNRPMDPNVLILGERILIPGATTDRDFLESGPGRPPGPPGHVVQPGDTLGQIASMWGVTVDALLELNRGLDPAALQVGQVLIVAPWGIDLDYQRSAPRPVPDDVLVPGDAPLEHEVVAGEDLASIAELYGVTSAQLVNANGLVDNGGDLTIGQVLLIPPPLSVGIAGTPAAPASQREELELQAAQWQATRPDDYYVRYSELRSEGSGIVVRSQVMSDQIVQIEPGADAGVSVRVWTVDDMFEATLAADIVREIEFDSATGAPTLLSLDPDRTVSGDEFAFRSIEVVSQSELNQIDQALAEWLPEPELPSPAVEAVGVWSVDQSAPASTFYPLHRVPGLDVYLYLEATQVCVIAAQTEESELGNGSGTCIEKATFMTSPIKLSQVGDGDDIASFLLVVPQYTAASVGWSAEGIGGELDVTERSALLTVEGQAEVGQHRIEFMCECGDQMFTLSES